MIKPEQSRAARGLLGWSQETLAKEVGVSTVSINNFERGHTDFKQETLKSLAAAFERHDIEFPDEYGVRRRTENVQIIKGDNYLNTLWDDIFQTLKDSGGEVLITNVDEKRTLDIEKNNLLSHIERLKNYNITERLLSCEGDDYFLMPKECYRWMSQELFTFSSSTYLYADRVAFQVWRQKIIVLIQSKEVHEAEVARFEHLWDSAKIPP